MPSMRPPEHAVHGCRTGRSDALIWCKSGDQHQKGAANLFRNDRQAGAILAEIRDVPRWYGFAR